MQEWSAYWQSLKTAEALAIGFCLSVLRCKVSYTCTSGGRHGTVVCFTPCKVRTMILFHASAVSWLLAAVLALLCALYRNSNRAYELMYKQCFAKQLYAWLARVFPPCVAPIWSPRTDVHTALVQGSSLDNIPPTCCIHGPDCLGTEMFSISKGNSDHPFSRTIY